jgi:hypothetical protein
LGRRRSWKNYNRQSFLGRTRCLNDQFRDD